MGFMDAFSKILGGKKKPGPEDTVKPPSAVLRENGIDPSNLKFKFNQDGSVAVTGEASDQQECDRICELIKGIPSVSGVQNNITIAAAAPEPAPEPAPEVVAETAEVAVEEAAPAEATATAAESKGRTYTVKSGDTLWKIAESMYGSGGKYMKIFEANTDLLENPDKIRPGQKLVIPDIE